MLCQIISTYFMMGTKIPGGDQIMLVWYQSFALKCSSIVLSYNPQT